MTHMDACMHAGRQCRHVSSWPHPLQLWLSAIMRSPAYIGAILDLDLEASSLLVEPPHLAVRVSCVVTRGAVIPGVVSCGMRVCLYVAQ